MDEQTKVAIRCIEKRCKNVRCGGVRVRSKETVAVIRLLERGVFDALALPYSEAKKYLDEYPNSVMLGARIRNVDDRYVLMTRKKSGKHFSNALVSVPKGNIGSQLQELFDGVTCLETGERLEERVEKLLSEKCDGIMVKASDAINAGFNKIRGIRYKYFDTDTFVSASSDDVIVVLCRNDSSVVESIKDADNKRVSRQMAVEKAVLRYMADNNLSSNCHISARSNMEKDRLAIKIYVNKDGYGRYFKVNGEYRDRENMIETVGKEIQSYILKSNVF